MNKICSTISLIIDDMHYNWKVNIIINAIRNISYQINIFLRSFVSVLISFYFAKQIHQKIRQRITHEIEILMIFTFLKLTIDVDYIL